MARLQAKEGDGGGRSAGDASHCPVSPSTPEGRSTASTGRPARELVDAADAIAPRGCQVPREAGAEQRVDDEVGVGEVESVGGSDSPFQRAAISRGVAAQIAGIAEKLRRRDSRAREQSRRDEAVAAVIAGTAEDGDSPRERARCSPRRRPRPGPLHQDDPSTSRLR